MRPFIVLAANVAIGSIGVWVGGFAGGCIFAAMVVADCMAVLAEGRAWAREDAHQERLEKLVELSSADDGLDWDALAGINAEGWDEPHTVRPFDWGREGRAG